MLAHNDKIITDIRRIIQTIATLQGENRQKWVSWCEVAKFQEGSEELATVLSGYASLPQTDCYFRQSADEKHVCLTELGHMLLQTTAEPTLSEPQRVANAVKSYARHLLPLRFKVVSVLPVGKSRRRFVHAIQVEIEDALVPNDAPVTLVSKKWAAQIYGQIISQDADEGILYVALDSRVWADLLPDYMVVDRAYLLHRLAESLAGLEDIPARGQALLTAADSNGLHIAHQDSGQVADMLAGLRPPWTKFLWGPPGAGKTYGLARLISQLLHRNPKERILIVAPSNVAVDVALLQVVNQLEENGPTSLVQDRRALRYGYPRHPDILGRPELLGSESEQDLSLLIKAKGNALKEAEKANGSEIDKAILRAEILDMLEELKQLIWQHIEHCQVVATTTTMAYMPNSPINKQEWTTVIVDEVTMVPPAMCLFLSSLAKERFLLAGDPRQLGPIFESANEQDPEAVNWMGRDVFDFSQLAKGEGITRQVRTDDLRLVRITSQRRSSRDIWQSIQHLYPAVSNLADETRLQRLCQLSPHKGQGVVSIDVGREVTGASCQRYQKSWENQKTAEYAVSLARETIGQIGQDISIAIITPYRAQYRLIKQLVKKAGLGQEIKVGTIHQFQGSEADVIIFDMVDGPGRRSLGRLLCGDTGLRLVNVAVSRARGKFFILADKSWCQAVMKRSENSVLWDLVMTKPQPEKNMGQTSPVLPDPASPQTLQTPASVEKHLARPQTLQTSTSVEKHPIDVSIHVDADWLRRLDVGVNCSIADRRIKRALNIALTQMKLQSHYDAAKRMTVWKNSEMQFWVDHKADTLNRMK